jgi:hypothetical protein
MSYKGIGEFYETGLGMGGCGCAGMGGCGCAGMSGCGCSGFGATSTLNVSAVLADIATSDKCYGPSPVKGFSTGTCNAAAARANKEIAVALNALGYGPMAVDGSTSWQSGYASFLAANGLVAGPGYGITAQALTLMNQQLVAGDKPGPGEVVGYKKVNGEYIPTGDKAINVAGLSGTPLLLAALAVGGVGYLVYRASKKKKGGRSIPSRPPMTSAMTVR